MAVSRGKMLGHYSRGPGGYKCPCCDEPDVTRWRKRVEAREVADDVARELADAELEAELPDPRILDDYEAVVPGARERLLAMRRQSAGWDEVGIALWSAARQMDRELRHEVPGWPA